MKKCNGTGLVLKICETKNNEWKRYMLSIQWSIDNNIETTRIKPNFASLNSKHIPGAKLLSSFGAKPLACELNEFVAKHEANMYKRTTLLVRSSFRTGKVVFAFYSVDVEKSLCICGL